MNLILITIDCLRADHLSCMGYSKHTTPNLDDIANTGVLFTQAISVSSWTPPSFIAIFSSTYPLMYGGKLYITDLRTTFPQILKQHGYRTGSFHSNVWLSSYYGYHAGFDTFYDTAHESGPRSFLLRPQKLVKRVLGVKSGLYKSLARLSMTVRGTPHITAQALNKRALSWLDGNRDDFFLWLHYMDVHRPYFSSLVSNSPIEKYRILKLEAKADRTPESLSPQEITELIDAYDANISYVDKQIGSLLCSLRERGLLENTIVFITADHGEQFREHGRMFHGIHLYDELTRVPLIIFGPGLKGQVIRHQVSLIDLAPTILDMLKIEKPKSFLGNSLLPLIMGEAEGGERSAISEEGRKQKEPRMRSRLHLDQRPELHRNEKKVSVRTDRWKYVYTEGGQEELYNLKNDPLEKQNVIEDESSIAEQMRARVMSHIELVDKTAPSEAETIKEKVRRLKRSGKI